MNGEFEFIRDSLPDKENLCTTFKTNNVLDIECKNRVIKECAIAPISTFPFNKIPGLIIIELI